MYITCNKLAFILKIQSHLCSTFCLSIYVWQLTSTKPWSWEQFQRWQNIRSHCKKSSLKRETKASRTQKNRILGRHVQSWRKLSILYRFSHMIFAQATCTSVRNISGNQAERRFLRVLLNAWKTWANDQQSLSLGLLALTALYKINSPANTKLFRLEHLWPAKMGRKKTVPSMLPHVICSVFKKKKGYSSLKKHTSIHFFSWNYHACRKADLNIQERKHRSRPTNNLDWSYQMVILIKLTNAQENKRKHRLSPKKYLLQALFPVVSHMVLNEQDFLCHEVVALNPVDFWKT